MISVLLLGSPSFCEECVSGLRSPEVRVVGAVHDPREAREISDALCPAAAVVDLETAGMEAAGALAGSNPSTMVFLASDRPSTDLWRRAVSAGARGVVRKPLRAPEFLRAVEDARQEEERRAGVVAAAGAEPAAQPRSGVVVAKQEIMVFFATKGGVGKTTLALNLAASYLNRGVPLKPVVADFDPCPKAAYVLNLPLTASLSDWSGIDASYLDSKALEGLLARHRSGLWLLPGVRYMFDGALTAEVADAVIGALSRAFDIIVIDAGQIPTDASVRAFERATRIFVVGDLQVQTLRAINEKAQEMEALLDPSKVRLVLNRIPKRPDISIRDVENLMCYPLCARIPEDPAVRVLENRGELAVLAKPDSPFSVEVKRLAGGVVPVSEKKRGLFSRLFSRSHGRAASL